MASQKTSIFKEPPAPEPEVEQRKTRMQEASEKAESRREVIRNSNIRERERAARAAEVQNFLASWATLSSAMRNNWILYGSVTHIETRELQRIDLENTGVFLALNLEENDQNFRVLVPFKDIYRDFPIDTNTVDLSTEEGRRDYLRRQKSMAEKLEGLEMPFCITGMEIDNREDLERRAYSISGSRAKALGIMERRNYTPNAKGIAEISEGDFVDAVITSTSRYAVAVEVGGIDTRIPVHNLTHEFISGPNSIPDKFRVGDKIRVQVLSIKERKDGRHLIEVSHKAAELDEAKRIQQSMPLPQRGRGGDISTVGIVTGVRMAANGRSINITIYLDKLRLPAFANGVQPKRMGYTPRVGDAVRVTLLEYRPNGLTRVRCHGFHAGLPTEKIR